MHRSAGCILAVIQSGRTLGRLLIGDAVALSVQLDVFLISLWFNLVLARQPQFQSNLSTAVFARLLNFKRCCSHNFFPLPFATRTLRSGSIANAQTHRICCRRPVAIPAASWSHSSPTVNTAFRVTVEPNLETLSTELFKVFEIQTENHCQFRWLVRGLGNHQILELLHCPGWNFGGNDSKSLQVKFLNF